MAFYADLKAVLIECGLYSLYGNVEQIVQFLYEKGLLSTKPTVDDAESNRKQTTEKYQTVGHDLI